MSKGPKNGEARMSRRQALLGVGSAALLSLQSSCASKESNAAASASSQSGKQPAMEPLHYSSLRDVARRIQSKEISPVELTTRMLDRIATVDPKLKSYATVMREQALEAAKRAEEEIQRGTYRGPLHGVPIAVKDLCYTKGVRTMAGTSIYANFIPDHDATVVTKLSQAGAVLLGKLNLTEGAMTGYNPARDIPVNPWREDLWAGTSSSGSGVATAAGLCYGSIGTDTGGSIRYPSAANGVVGLKPTYGRVSRYGVFPLAESLDHVGPIVRRAGDAAVMLEAIAGFDSNDPTSLKAPVPYILDELNKDVRGLRIGFDRRFATEGIHPEQSAALQSAVDLVDRASLDALVDTYEHKVGPRNGARVVARAWTDPAFKQRLLENGTAAIAELGYTGEQGADIRVVENTPKVHNLIVCTLCSCYPWPVLGLPPVWYKSAPYRSRAVIDPRGVLREFETQLAEDVEVRVWDSTAEERYLVLPERPAGTENLKEDALASLVTRDSMIGVSKVAPPAGGKA